MFWNRHTILKRKDPFFGNVFLLSEEGICFTFNLCWYISITYLWDRNEYNHELTGSRDIRTTFFQHCARKFNNLIVPDEVVFLCMNGPIETIRKITEDLIRFKTIWNTQIMTKKYLVEWFIIGTSTWHINELVLFVYIQYSFFLAL